MLLEKDSHPRFHIGESLLPGNVAILKQLGVLEQVRDIAVHKPGADFTGPDGITHNFPFATALGTTPDYAFQVLRSQFDELLFANCVAKGVDARQQHQVISVAARNDGAHLVVYTDTRDIKHAVVARLVIDASGRDALMAKQQGWHQPSRRHASAAVFGHFRLAQPRQGNLEGNISVYWFEGGWIWMIPLPDGVMSIGAVCCPSLLKQRHTNLETFLRHILAGVPDTATRTADMVALGPVHATGNYSYQSRYSHAAGVLLVGDAYAFIDPVFSSGVYLAMNSAVACLAPARAWLRGDRRQYRRATRRFTTRVDRKMGAFAWFILRFTTPAMREMFRNPRNDWRVRQAVVSMLAGDGDGSADIRTRLRLFRILYMGYRLRRGLSSWRAWLLRRKNRQVVFQDETILH